MAIDSIGFILWRLDLCGYRIVVGYCGNGPSMDSSALD
jgi:hypothetical protein